MVAKQLQKGVKLLYYRVFRLIKCVSELRPNLATKHFFLIPIFAKEKCKISIRIGLTQLAEANNADSPNRL